IDVPHAKFLIANSKLREHWRKESPLFASPPRAGSPPRRRVREAVLIEHCPEEARRLAFERVAREQLQNRGRAFEQSAAETLEPCLLFEPAERGEPHLPV